MIDHDPFASAPVEDEAQTEIPEAAEPAADPEPEPAPAKKAPVKKTASTVTPVVNVGPSEGKVTVTLKGGAAFTDPWIVIHASDVNDALDHFMGDNGQALGQLMERVQNAGKGFVKLGGGTTAPASNGGQVNRSAPPQGAIDAPPWAPAKPFDDFVYVTKVSAKTGKPWHAWMAPNKGDNREPLFFNAPR